MKKDLEVLTIDAGDNKSHVKAMLGNKVIYQSRDIRTGTNLLKKEENKVEKFAEVWSCCKSLPKSLRVLFIQELYKVGWNSRPQGNKRTIRVGTNGNLIIHQICRAVGGEVIYNSKSMIRDSKQAAYTYSHVSNYVDGWNDILGLDETMKALIVEHLFKKETA